MRTVSKTLAVATAALALTSAIGAGQCGPTGCPAPPAMPRTPTLPPSTTYPAGPTPAVRAARRSVARIVHREASGVSLGSGVLVATRPDASYFATCAHLFDGPGTTEVRLNGARLPARVVAIDRRNDLALLRTPRTRESPIRVADPDPNGLLTACGFGPTGEFRCVTGLITGSATAVGAVAPSLRIRGAVRSGDSGGPVLDARGRLVAIIWGQRGGETFAMTGAPLRAVLAKIPPQRPPTASAPPIPRNPTTPAPTSPPDAIRRSDLDRLEARWDRRLERLLQQYQPASDQAPPSGSRDWLRYADPLATVLAVGTPLGVGLLAGRAWLRRCATRAGPERPIGGPTAVAVDSPPPPQQVVPQTHYVSYERDEFAKAHQWACEQVARKFPGSVELLANLDSLIKQQLNGGARR